MKPVAAILLFAAALPLATSGQQMPDGLRRNSFGRFASLAHFPDANEWLAAAVQHEPGLVDDAATKIATWPAKRLIAALDAVGALHSSDELNAALARGAMLHTDIWLLTGEQLPAPPGRTWDGEESVILLKDGQQIGRGEIAGQIAFARRVIKAMRPATKERGALRFDRRVPQWFRAVAAIFAYNLWLSDLRPHQRAAREAFPEDAGILFDSACAGEAMASSAIQAGVPGPEVPISRVARERLSVRFNRAEAERFYGLALQHEPAMHEARIRLANVLAQRGARKQAIAVLTESRRDVEPIVEYFAAVILADALEDEGRTDEARTAYRRASVLYPNAQSPLVGLSRIAREQGDLAGARAAMARLTTLPPQRQGSDPWWKYYLCTGRNAELELGRLRYAFRTSEIP